MLNKFRSDGFKHLGREIPNPSIGFSVQLFDDGVMIPFVHVHKSTWAEAKNHVWGEKRFDSHTFNSHYFWWFPVTRSRGQTYIDNDDWSQFVYSLLNKEEFSINVSVRNLQEHFNWCPPPFFEEIEL